MPMEKHDPSNPITFVNEGTRIETLTALNDTRNRLAYLALPLIARNPSIWLFTGFIIMPYLVIGFKAINQTVKCVSTALYSVTPAIDCVILVN